MRDTAADSTIFLTPPDFALDDDLDEDEDDDDESEFDDEDDEESDEDDEDQDDDEPETWQVSPGRGIPLKYGGA